MQQNFISAMERSLGSTAAQRAAEPIVWIEDWFYGIFSTIAPFGIPRRNAGTGQKSPARIWAILT
ncbi:hypothetical protein N7455_011201 [Penicillium solitum]|uniref:uncharacterized protein n=1 Tax=Penicillium solitum TaxID=60172 RepID=UPI00178ED225|nr:hypothetical protein HAV15_009928 [Penicillium sp. str. \